ncbi:medium-chain fatty acid ethyl ester synthase/esterase [Histoplasma capsulatum var. duboisii H88]|uniref:alcohol O-acetyltransferase n=1 Tax=Ajellomyces capsulatus (strain H88) TaxID=544711 RepID=F0UR80_AJEC8|nr:medium-chain fatty acid ethyl ester synthase/esterase [Histoplasma capsulatum var. duboisii H88]QSS50426.1 medium-chain fatty acid ethyl ester synthase/esterase [Histoplasma capsulatum var. duboisii H88]
MGYLSSLLPSGKVSFHYAPNVLQLALKRPASLATSSTSPIQEDTKEVTQGEKDQDQPYISLAELCETSTPKKCQLNPLLFNGHLQTAYTAVKSDDTPVYYKRWTFQSNSAAYRGTFDVDFVVPPYEISLTEDTNRGAQETISKSPMNAAPPPHLLPPRTTFFTEEEFASLPSTTDTTPMLVVLHGLSGGSHEIYLRHVIAPLFEAGWAACVLNFRGCAKSRITSPILYNARATWDVRQLVGWVKEAFPQRRLFGIGFSLGANVLTNYLGEEGASCPLSAAVICSSPWNLEVSSKALKRTWMGMEVYSKTMGSNMKNLFEQHVDEISKHPAVNVERVRNIKYLHEFDRELQGPVWGYPTETAYYRDASSIDSIFAIKVPFFAIQAEDDPIAVGEALPYEEIKQTPYGVMCTTSWGGHLSWFEYGGTRWFTKPITTFLTKMATEIDLDAPYNIEGADAQEINRKTQQQNTYVDPMPKFFAMRRKMDLPIVHFMGLRKSTGAERDD